MSARDGGPAFASGNAEQGGADGMSLRDYFAAKAMQAMIVNDDDCAFHNDIRRRAASVAYIVADEMLKARAT